MARTSLCPSLPPEIWGMVLRQIDDPFDLWTTCRQISNGIKVEAERTFRLRFLPDLRIQWTMSRDDPYGTIDDTTVLAGPDYALMDVASSSAVFSIQVRGPMCDAPLTVSETEREKIVLQALRYRDHNATTRAFLNSPGLLFPAVAHQMLIFFDTANLLACYVNDPEIPNLDLHLVPCREQVPVEQWSDYGHVIFNWKELMTSYFAEELWVRRQSSCSMKSNQRGDPANLLQDIKDSLSKNIPTLEMATVDGKPTLTINHQYEEIFEDTKCDNIEAVICAYVPDHVDLYTEAYKNRLIKAYREVCDGATPEGASPPDLNSFADYHIDSWLFAQRWHVTKAAWKYWAQEIGEVFWDDDDLHTVYNHEEGMRFLQAPPA